jgi:Cell Wall Hydrolase
MPAALSRLICAAAIAAGIAVPGAASAQALARWDDAQRFLPPALGGERPEAAAECLALAITYEAGFEPLVGQEAVAQVILNRVRHPAYPDTACGVVWQGSERRTGCQFTFTCDGSLRRVRSGSAIAAARAVAVRVLAGESADHVRGATHYHADYVAPYWAPSLTRVRQIATHVFYRSPGATLRSDGAPIIVALAAEYPAQTTPPPVAAPEPVIRNGAFAPWGLTISSNDGR